MKTLQINNNHQEWDVVMLPTKDDSARIIKSEDRDYLVFVDKWSGKHIANHLYILSNDEIKYGDWFIELDLNGKRSSYSNKPYLCDIGNTGGFILTKNDGNFPFPENCRKIIATTDSSLVINNGTFDDGTGTQLPLLNTFLPQIPKSFIEKYITEHNKGNVISKVLVEVENDYEEPQGDYFRIKLSQNNEISILTEQKQVFSREEVVDMLLTYKCDLLVELNRCRKSGESFQKQFTDNWIQQNLK